MIQRWVEGSVRKLPAPAGTVGRLGLAAQPAARCVRNSCQTNMATAQAAMIQKVPISAP